MPNSNNDLSPTVIKETLNRFRNIAALPIDDRTICYVDPSEGFSSCHRERIDEEIDPEGRAEHILAIRRRDSHVNDTRVLFVDESGKLFATTQQYSGPDISNGGNQFIIETNNVEQQELEGVIGVMRERIEALLSPQAIASTLEKFATMESFSVDCNNIYYISDRGEGFSMCNGEKIKEVDPKNEATHLIGTYFETERRNVMSVFFVKKDGELLAHTLQHSGVQWGNTIDTHPGTKSQIWFEEVMLQISRYVENSGK